MILRRLGAPHATVPAAAVFVQTSPLGAHVGVAYLADGDEGWLIHQVWNRVSLHEPLAKAHERGESVFFVPPGLDRDEQLSLRAWAILAAKRIPESGLPYAFGTATLDSEQGFVLGEGCGLSCATLVNVIFEAAKVPLLDMPTWTSQRTKQRDDEDREVQKQVGNLLARGHGAGDRKQAKLVLADLGRARLRAEEVAAASGREKRPLALKTVEPLGRQVIDELRAQTA